MMMESPLLKMTEMKENYIVYDSSNSDYTWNIPTENVVNAKGLWEQLGELGKREQKINQCLLTPQECYLKEDSFSQPEDLLKEYENGYKLFDGVYYKEHTISDSQVWQLADKPDNSGHVLIFNATNYLLPTCIEEFKKQTKTK